MSPAQRMPHEASSSTGSLRPLARVGFAGCIGLIAALLGCDRDPDEDARRAPAFSEPRSATPEDAAPPSGLVAVEGGHVWHPPGGRTGPADGCMTIDNGTDRAARVRLPDGAVLQVEPGTHPRLCTLAGELAFTAIEGDRELELRADLSAERLTVYDVGAAWDYALVERTYNTAGVGPGDLPTEIVATLLFAVAAVDHELTPLPASIDVDVEPGDVFPVRALRQIDHLGSPHRDRKIVALPSTPFAAVVQDGTRWVLQGRSPSEPSTVFIDNPGRAALAIAVDGVPIGEVAARTFVRLELPAGAHELHATSKSRTVGAPLSTELAPGTRHLWEPTGRQRYAIEVVDYGAPVLPTFGSGVPRPIEERGFFAVDTAYVLEPFPESIETAFGLGDSRSRLVHR